MSNYTVRVCDACGKVVTRESMKKLDWSDRVQEIILDASGHIGVHKKKKYDLCTKCGLELFDSFEKHIQKINKASIKNEQKDDIVA